jgi:hypothetical protein
MLNLLDFEKVFDPVTFGLIDVIKPELEVISWKHLSAYSA